MDREKIIKKLNIINKLLRQDLVALKKGGRVDPEALMEINNEIKAFLTAQMDSLLGARDVIDSGAVNQQGFIEFSPQEAAVLKEFAHKLLSRAVVDNAAAPTLSVTLPETNTPYLDFVQPPPPKTKVSPVLDALAKAGFSPDVGSPAERAAKMKEIEKSKK